MSSAVSRIIDTLRDDGGLRDTDIANIIGVFPREVPPWLGGEATPAPQNGGSLPLATTGRFIGPGGQEALKTSKGDMLAYHYYDGLRWRRGRPAVADSLDLGRLARA
jgi:hypothetical protein